MAVISVSLKWSSRPMEFGVGGFTLRDVYEVLIQHEPGVDPRQMIRDAQNVGTLPRRGSGHPLMSGFRCSGGSARPGAGPTTWELDALFSNSFSLENIADPTLAPPSIEYTVEDSIEEFDTDLDNAPVATTAGEPYEQKLAVPISDVVISYGFNAPEGTINPGYFVALANKVNAATWNGLAAGRVLVLGAPRVPYVYATDDTPAYWQVQFRLGVRAAFTDPGAPAASAWFERRLNQGFRHLDDGELKLALDENGMPLNRPVLLDAAGAITTVPYWNYFRRYAAADFSGINLVLP